MKDGAVSPFHALHGFGISHGPVLLDQFWKGTMPLEKRWLGCMLIGVGLLLFAVSRQNWQERADFAIIAAGIVLNLPKRITGSPTS